MLGEYVGDGGLVLWVLDICFKWFLLIWILALLFEHSLKPNSCWWLKCPCFIVGNRT